MRQDGTVTVPPSFIRSLGLVFIGCLFLAGGLVLIFGTRPWVIYACVAFAALALLLFLLAMILRRPRVVISPEGFTVHGTIGRQSYKWEDIQGRFAVIRIGVTKMVAFHLTAEYKERVGRKPTSRFAGYDQAFVGGFQLSLESLAELLNEHKEGGGRSPASSAAGGGNPAPPPTPD
jgi:hypothetical protein